FFGRLGQDLPGLLGSVSDPWMVGAYAVGAMGYRWVRTRSLGSLLKGWGRDWVGTPLGPRILASVAGLGVESGLFLGVNKWGHGLSGLEQDWSVEALGREYKKTLTDFALMKLGGRLGGGVSKALSPRLKVGKVLAEGGLPLLGI